MPDTFRLSDIFLNSKESSVKEVGSIPRTGKLGFCVLGKKEKKENIYRTYALGQTPTVLGIFMKLPTNLMSETTPLGSSRK